MTLNAVRRSLISHLGQLYPEGEASAITRLILEHCGFPPGYILQNGNELTRNAVIIQINEIVAELAQLKPVQYVLGEAFFHDLRFIVNESVLIPRQETEELVVLIAKEYRNRKVVLCDIGTGSGCIAVTLAHLLPTAEIHATDLSPAALKLARENALLNSCEVHFHLNDFLSDQPLPEKLLTDVLVSNPPYVTVSEKQQMESRVKDHEPALALFVPDEDPLIYYRRMAELAPSYLNPGGTIWLEINERFGKETCELFNTSPYKGTSIIKDIHQKDRFIKAWI